jgi:hypothetical protein
VPEVCPRLLKCPLFVYAVAEVWTMYTWSD